jgi:hypothetical protein
MAGRSVGMRSVSHPGRCPTRRITVKSTQIQYSQQVFLNFNTLTWPHVSVATLVASEPIPVPHSAFT